jgi:hypothetical protein
MTELPRILSVEPVIQGVLKLTWNDGFDGVVDLTRHHRTREGVRTTQQPRLFPQCAAQRLWSFDLLGRGR